MSSAAIKSPLIYDRNTMILRSILIDGVSLTDSVNAHCSCSDIATNAASAMRLCQYAVGPIISSKGVDRAVEKYVSQ